MRETDRCTPLVWLDRTDIASYFINLHGSSTGKCYWRIEEGEGSVTHRMVVDGGRLLGLRPKKHRKAKRDRGPKGSELGEIVTGNIFWLKTFTIFRSETSVRLKQLCKSSKSSNKIEQSIFFQSWKTESYYSSTIYKLVNFRKTVNGALPLKKLQALVRGISPGLGARMCWVLVLPLLQTSLNNLHLCHIRKYHDLAQVVAA